MMEKRVIPLPMCLDFYSLQDEGSTRIHRFFDDLKNGKLTTTKCKGCGELLWQPRVVCPSCLSEDLEWVEIPKTGKLYAFSAMVAGAPLGMEKEVPFSIGIVEMDDTGIKILTRVDGKLEDLKIDMPVELETYDVEGDRIFYRFKPK